LTFGRAAPKLVNGSIQLAWTALSGVQYQGQDKTGLAQTGRINFSSVITAAMKSMTFVQIF
jgi:hypothetical protein